MGRPKKQLQDNYVPTDEERKAMSWCIDRKIKVYPVPKDNEYELHIEVSDNGRIERIKSPKLYPKDNYLSTLWGLYLHYYKKLS